MADHSAHSETATTDWKRAHEAVAEAYFPHELTPLRSPERMKLRLQTVDLGPVTIGRLNWGTDVSIGCDYPGAYEINIPLSGRLHSQSTEGEVVSVPGRATIFQANRPSVITNWTADCHVVGVKFDAEYLEREADRINISPFTRRIQLPNQLDLASPDGGSWLTLVKALSAQLREPANLLANPLVGPQLASAVTSAFILAVAPLEGAPEISLRPRMVKRVLDALHDDPARAWTLGEMTQIGGSSARRLQQGFMQYVGMSPTAALAHIRLSRAHDDLLAARSGDTVADIAARWGFSSASRFAATYRRRYGKSPSHMIRL